jgi:hypothetical protein
MMEAVRTCETSVTFYETVRCSIPEDSRRQKLKCHQITGRLLNDVIKIFIIVTLCTIKSPVVTMCPVCFNNDYCLLEKLTVV